MLILKNLENRRARHLKKGRACQEDPNNKKIKVCDKIILSFKTDHKRGKNLGLQGNKKKIHLGNW